MVALKGRQTSVLLAAHQEYGLDYLSEVFEDRFYVRPGVAAEKC